jgi:osmoprotectant transport system permease protein
VRSLLQAVKYRALAEGAVDVIDGYSTDGLIAKLRPGGAGGRQRFFPPYEAAALVSPGSGATRPRRCGRSRG